MTAPRESRRSPEVSRASTLAVVVCLALLLLSACTGGWTRAYSGLEQPVERIAVLKHQTGFNNPSVYFIRIDGMPISGRKYRYGEIELLPGRHEVEFGFEAAGLSLTYSYSTEHARVVFEAEANHEYEARAEKLTSAWTALVCRARGQVLKVVKTVWIARRSSHTIRRSERTTSAV